MKFTSLSKYTSKRKKNVFWPNLASARYANDTLARLEDLKIEYVPKEKKIHQTSHSNGQSKSLKQQFSSKKRKVLDGKD
jgi:hypothetical protein